MTGKFASTLRNIIEIGMFFLLVDLIYVISMIGIKFDETNATMRELIQLLTMMAKRFGVN